jgi:hypothetical protein
MSLLLTRLEQSVRRRAPVGGATLIGTRVIGLLTRLSASAADGSLRRASFLSRSWPRPRVMRSRISVEGKAGDRDRFEPVDRRGGGLGQHAKYRCAPLSRDFELG